MESYIDRNPEQMIRYAKEVKDVINEMTVTIKKVEGVLAAYENDLDGPTRKQIKKLNEYCSEYLKLIDKLVDITDTIYMKGKRLSDIRGGF